MSKWCLIVGLVIAQEPWKALRPIYTPKPLPSAEKPRRFEPAPARIIWAPSPAAQALYEKVLQQTHSAATLPGYRIQILATSVRAEADSVRFFFLENFTEQSIHMVYEAPLYKLRIGDFLERREAERWLERYRRIFPGAFIVPDKVLRP
ncbi:MAG: SPOR domain-containing protein [Bacteroidia bacterium]|nr:SPOR domain-containing protein [Bacteroidia bacterium]MCX7651623.1 SPOR domain-containing protein [Bacteroidia bacterium]MDW8417292.1 SPOR domain-containing protein [Bacteroidia bacterium]